ncbi:unnamed protein product [Polarella glacialis]|uniref:J domain-containing protein n=1 Tax=Polarella glacialis TaxID=89957 RepID=A0A813HBE4_POLGL|nr:unnamed protein product [Polarella glacialis]
MRRRRVSRQPHLRHGGPSAFFVTASVAAVLAAAAAAVATAGHAAGMLGVCRAWKAPAFLSVFAARGGSFPRRTAGPELASSCDAGDWLVRGASSMNWFARTQQPCLSSIIRSGLGAGSPWDVLGVAPGSSQAEVKRAYRRKALKEHPDVSRLPDAKQRWQELSAAYDALSDSEKFRAWERAQQDAQRGGARQKTASSSSSSSRTGPRTREVEEENDAGGDTFGSIFSDLFGAVAEASAASEEREGARGASRVRQAGSMLLEDLLEFLEKGSTGDATQSPFGGPEPEQELREAQLELSTMQSQDEALRSAVDAWELKARLCRDSGDQAGELDGMRQVFDVRERRKTVRRRILSLTERVEYLQKVIFEVQKKKQQRKLDCSWLPSRQRVVGLEGAAAGENFAKL